MGAGFLTTDVLHLSVCLSQRRVFLQTLAMGCVLCVAWVYFSMILPPGETQLSQLGLFCSVFTVSMYLSPLADLVNAHLHNIFTAELQDMWNVADHHRIICSTHSKESSSIAPREQMLTGCSIYYANWMPLC